MPSTDVAIANRPQQPAKQVKTPKVGGKTKAAIDLMVWEGLTDSQAAVRMQITLGAIRLALKQPHYRAYLRSECEMLRLRESPRNLHAYIDVRDNSGNAMARIAAGKALDGQSDQQVSSSTQRSPGVVIQIIGNASVSAQPLGGRIAGEDHITQVIDNAGE